MLQKQVDPVPVDEAIKLKKFYADVEKNAGVYFKGKHQKIHAKTVFDGLQSDSMFGGAAKTFINEHCKHHVHEKNSWRIMKAIDTSHCRV